MRTASAERGFALAMAMWMLAVLSVLALGFGTFSVSEVTQSSRLQAEMRARILATGAIHKSIGLLIEDRPSASITTKGIVLSEVNLRPYVAPKARINGAWDPTTGSRMMSVINVGSTSIDYSAGGFFLDDENPPSGANAPLIGTAKPGVCTWVVASNVSFTAGTVYLFRTQGSGYALVDQWTHGAIVDKERYALLPDGGVLHDLTDAPDSYWVKVHVDEDYDSGSWEDRLRPASGTWAPTTDTNGMGVWLDGISVKKRRGGSTLDAAYTFPDGDYFLANGKSVLLANGFGATPTGAETTIRTNSPSDTIPYISHLVANADSISYSLERSGATIFGSRRLDFTSGSARYIAITASDSMYRADGNDAPGAVEGTVSKSIPFISEIYDASGASVTQLLTDPSFEQWTSAVPDIWLEGGTASSIDDEATPVRTGSLSARFFNPTTSNTGRVLYSESVTVSAGSTVDFGVWGHMNSAGTAATTDAFVTIRWVDSSDVLISEGHAAWDSAFSTNAGWVEFRADDTTAPAGTAKADLVLRATNQTTVTSEHVFWDDAFIDLQGGSSPYHADEFLEISLDSNTAYVYTTAAEERRLEYIELVNIDDVGINVELEDYYINVGDGTNGASTRRYLHTHPILTGSDTIPSYGFGIIVPADFTATDAVTLGISSDTSIYKFFALSGVAAAGVGTDTGLRRGTDALLDTGDIVVIGSLNFADQVTQGTTFAAADTAGYTWQKIKPETLDDSTTPFTTWNASNWQTSGGQNNGAPGSGNVPTGDGRVGWDAHAIDSWDNNSDSWTQIGTVGWMRYEIRDEGAKTNINNAPRDLIWRAMAYDAADADFFTGYPLPDVTGAITTTNEYRAGLIADEIYNKWGAWKWGSVPQLASPEHSFYAYLSSQPSGYRGVDVKNARLLSPYGPAAISAASTGKDFKVNVHYSVTTADSPPLLAALASAPTISGDTVISIFKKVQEYVLGADRVPGGTGNNADSYYVTVAEMWSLTRPFISPGLTAGEQTALASCGLTDTIAVSSNQFFRIIGSGAVYEGSGTPTSGAETTAFRMSLAVVRRSTTADKALILFWRNIWDDAITYPR